jgi:uncharacterized protein YndB with AHSA1/START domain
MSKIKYEIEFPIHASPHMLYQYFSTPSGLEEWFADKANSRGKVITFFWDDSEEEAMIVSRKQDERARFKWTESEGDDTYFEFRIQVDAITKDVSLMVTDFADEDELEESKMLWENQIEELKHRIGA